MLDNPDPHWILRMMRRIIPAHSITKFCAKLTQSRSRDGNSAAYAAASRLRAVVGAPRRPEWQLKPALCNSVSAAPRIIIFYIFLQLLLVIFSL